jgi:hypothetical protein
VAIRFHKSIRVGPFRLNLNKRSASVSAKIGPIRRTVGTRGTTTSVDLPGPWSWVTRKGRTR